MLKRRANYKLARAAGAYSGKISLAEIRKRQRAARGHVVDVARTDTTVSRYSPGNFNGARNSFMPEELRVKLVYNEVFTDQTLTVGGTNTHYFRLSNPTDPLQTSGGHQPMGYDQLTSLYSKCTVPSCKITWQVYPADSAAFNTHIQVTGRPFTSNDTVPVVINDEMERGNAICTVVSGSNAAAQPNSMYVKNWARAGHTSPKDYENDDDYEIVNQNTTFNPTDEIRFAILTSGIGVATDIKYALVVNIVYYCKFSERRIVSPS